MFVSHKHGFRFLSMFLQTVPGTEVQFEILRITNSSHPKSNVCIITHLRGIEAWICSFFQGWSPKSQISNQQTFSIQFGSVLLLVIILRRQTQLKTKWSTMRRNTNQQLLVHFGRSYRMYCAWQNHNLWSCSPYFSRPKKNHVLFGKNVHTIVWQVGTGPTLVE